MLQEKNATLRHKEHTITTTINKWHQGLLDQQSSSPQQEDDSISYFLTHHLRSEKKRNIHTLSDTLQERAEIYPEYDLLAFTSLQDEIQLCIELHDACTKLRTHVHQTLISQHQKHQHALTNIANQEAIHTKQTKLTEHAIVTRINNLSDSERAYFLALW